MFSKAHAEKIQRAAGVGNNLDLFDEIQLMEKVTWSVSQETYDTLMSTANLYDFNGDMRMIYNSMRIKLIIDK